MKSKKRLTVAAALMAIALVSCSNKKNEKVIGFNAYNRKPYQRPKEQVLFYLEHGRVTESPECIKMYESVPKRLGREYVGKVLIREAKSASEKLTVDN